MLALSTRYREVLGLILAVKYQGTKKIGVRKTLALLSGIVVNSLAPKDTMNYSTGFESKNFISMV